MFDLFGMMDKIGKLKEAVEDVRNQCDRLHITQRSENGEVEVVCTANKKIISIKTLPAYLNSENAQFGMQVLHVAQLQPIHELVVAVHIGKVDATESAHAIDTLENAVWGDDGTFTLHWHDGRTLVVNG